MKKSLFYFIATMLIVFYSGILFGQCTPDPAVTDPEGNGEMVPDTIEAIETIPLNQTLTIIAPDTANYQGNTLNIHHITLKTLQNKPAWLSYVCNPSNCEFVGTESRCAQVTGTPPAGSAGFYPVDVLVDVYVLISVPVCVTCTTYPNGYDSGIPMIVWVHPQSAGLTKNTLKGFKVMEPHPNPFTSQTKLGFYTENPQKVFLKIVDMVGQEVYSEYVNAPAGENYFRFNGSQLSKGIYFYAVSDAQNRVMTKKIIKVE